MATVKTALGFSAKARIHHAVFGPGTVVATDGQRTTIAFDDSGTRKFVTRMVELIASDTPTPKKRGSRKKKVVASA